MGDLQTKIAYLRRLAPADRKIKQRDFENRLGLAPGTLSEEFGTVPTTSTPAPAKPKAKAKPKAAKAKPKTTKATTKKKKTTKKKSE